MLFKYSDFDGGSDFTSNSVGNRFHALICTVCFMSGNPIVDRRSGNPVLSGKSFDLYALFPLIKHVFDLLRLTQGVEIGEGEKGGEVTRRCLIISATEW